MAETTPLGEFDFFGRTITLDSGNMMNHDSLLQLGRELQPDASDEVIESRIDEAYDCYVDRFLEALAQGRPLSELPTAELEAIVSITNEQSTCKSRILCTLLLQDRTCEAQLWHEHMLINLQGRA